MSKTNKNKQTFITLVLNWVYSIEFGIFFINKSFFSNNFFFQTTFFPFV